MGRLCEFWTIGVNTVRPLLDPYLTLMIFPKNLGEIVALEGVNMRKMDNSCGAMRGNGLIINIYRYGI